MKLSELMRPDSQVFVKSEFGPAGSQWPALSFSSIKIATDFSNAYRPNRDWVIYVGTGDKQKTEDPAHRRRFLSVCSVEPRTPISTSDIVPPLSWENAVAKWGVRWEWSLPMVRVFSIDGFPLASELAPETYRSLGTLRSLGRCVEVQPQELPALIELELIETTIELTARAKAVLRLNTEDDALKLEASRLAQLIQQDVSRAGMEQNGTAPHRSAPNISDVYASILEKWNQQDGRCALCEGAIPLETNNRLLQMSRDRIDSDNKSYEASNLHLTHLGCNLAKSDGTMEQWTEFLEVVRRVRRG
jgi:hypothetical protein